MHSDRFNLMSLLSKSYLALRKAKVNGKFAVCDNLLNAKQDNYITLAKYGHHLSVIVGL